MDSTNTMNRLLEAFKPTLQDFMASPAIAALATGEMTVDEYRSITRELYHQVRETPQLFAMATTTFKGRQRDLVKMVLSHSLSEVGHEQLALNDYVTLGGDGERIPYETPLPTTTALFGYWRYQMTNLRPMGFLGYVFFLEFLPTHAGNGMKDMLMRIGVPEAAVTFLAEHNEADVHHNRLMEKYAEGLIVNEADFAAVVYGMQTTGRLYAQMLQAAREDVQRPFARGWNWFELEADGLTPESLGAKRKVA
ncbi:MAG: iron-containing redox enzyme family protein [Pseudomonadota bacterium]